MDPLTAAVIGSAILGAVAGERQGAANRRALKDQMKEQARRDKLNMIASAYGINARMSPAQYMPPGGAETMQGALLGAQFAQLNKSLWDDTKKANPNPNANLTTYNQSPYENYYRGYNGNLYSANTV